MLSAVSNADSERSILNLDALAATPLQDDPFDFIAVPGFVKTNALAAANQDYPAIDRPSNLPPESLSYGPGFQRLLDALNGPEFAQRLGDKFGVDLMACPTTITVRKYCEASDGNIHTDHRSKIITVIVYFNEAWPHEAGKLRMLRSKTEIEDYAAEVPPLGGTLLAFRRTDHSFHGHTRFEGERRMLQMNFLKLGTLSQYRQRFDRFSTHLMKRVLRLGRGAEPT
jgi:hypothetical protein